MTTDVPSPDEFEEAMAHAKDLGVAALTGVMATMRPLIERTYRAQIRGVLERNTGIVEQFPEALDHLENELIDALMPPDIDTLGIEGL